MTLEGKRRSVGVFARRSDVEMALQELKATHFPMHKVSVVAPKAEDQNDIAGVQVKEHTGNTSEEGASAGAVTGGALGGLTGLLVGLGILAIPGVGPIMLAGAGATAIATTLAGGAIGAAAGSLGGALLGLGIPEEQAIIYSDLVSKGYYLVIVTGTEAEIRHAKVIFHHQGVQEWGIYELPLSRNDRYKYGIGVFYTRHEMEKALTELRTAGFPMNYVSVIANDDSTLRNLADVSISSSKHKYAALQIPDDLAKYYQHRVKLGDYLVVLNGTDIHMAGARIILERNGIQRFRIYSRPTANVNQSDYQVLSTNTYF